MNRAVICAIATLLSAGMVAQASAQAPGREQDRPGRPSEQWRPAPRPPILIGPPGFRPGFPAARFQIGAYRRPPGYVYRQWGIGLALPIFLRTQSYWIGGFETYGLRRPPFGAHWVRVDDDALLVADDSGQIIEVQHGIFY